MRSRKIETQSRRTREELICDIVFYVSRCDHGATRTMIARGLGLSKSPSLVHALTECVNQGRLECVHVMDDRVLGTYWYRVPPR